MGNENENNTDNKNNEEFFKDESRENKLQLKYKIDFPGKNIRLVGSKFYENNKKNCKMCIDFV